MEMDIRAGGLSVLLIGEWNYRELMVFDWKTAQI
jgi:hypothetical protein